MKYDSKKLKAGKLRKRTETRMLLGSRFKVMCADAGLSSDQVAKLLRVTDRTVRYWFSGQTSVPYASYRLLRILCRYELPDPRGTSGRRSRPAGRARRFAGA